MLGPVVFERAYYLCAACHQRQSSRDRELDVVGTEYSPGVRRMMAWWAARSASTRATHNCNCWPAWKSPPKPSNATRKPSGRTSSNRNTQEEPRRAVGVPRGLGCGGLRDVHHGGDRTQDLRSEEHTSELQS